MAENTAIEWCDHTFNPWIGCTKVSPGCDHCYAERREDLRLHRVQWGAGQPRHRTKTWGDPGRWNKQPYFECLQCRWRGPDSATITIDNPPGFHPPVTWTRGCPACRQPTLKETRARVFCASLADVFDNEVPPVWRANLFDLIASTPNLDWLLLTKRIGNAWPMMLEVSARCGGGEQPIAHVCIGATMVNQPEWDRDAGKLRDLARRGWKTFVSLEPLLGPIDMRLHRVDGTAIDALCDDCGERHAGDCEQGIGWVIAGGETGQGEHKARPAHPDWFRSLRDQCAAAGVPFLFKQWGEWTPGENVERVRGVVETAFLHDDGWHIHPLNLTTDQGHIDDQPDLYRVGKKAAGRLLDGVEHNGFPA